MTILHLSHTDIVSDSRILKEMHTLKTNNSFSKIIGVGLYLDNGSKATQQADGLEIYRIVLKTRQWQYLPKSIRHLFSFFEILYKILIIIKNKKINLVHCHDTYILPIGVLLKIINKSKLIYDAHELESNRNGISKFFGKMIFITEKICWTFVDGLIVVSPFIVKWYKENIGDKETELILNSPMFNKNTQKEEKKYLRKKFLIPQESKIFLYVGGLMKGRGLKLIIEAFKKPEVKSHLVFLGYGDMYNEILEISKQFSNIHIHEAVAHEKVVSITKSADVGLCFIENVSLSDYYCLPNKLFEYAFAGIPILASNFPDISELIYKYNLGQCSDLGKDDIYKAIKKFENSQENLVVDTDRLYELSWEAQEKKLLSFYSKILN